MRHIALAVLALLTAVPANAAETRLACTVHSGQATANRTTVTRHYVLDTEKEELSIIIDGNMRPACLVPRCVQITPEAIIVTNNYSSETIRTKSRTVIDRISGGLSETHDTYQNDKPFLYSTFSGECRRAGPPKF